MSISCDDNHYTTIDSDDDAVKFVDGDEHHTNIEFKLISSIIFFFFPEVTLQTSIDGSDC